MFFVVEANPMSDERYLNHDAVTGWLRLAAEVVRGCNADERRRWQEWAVERQTHGTPGVMRASPHVTDLWTGRPTASRRPRKAQASAKQGHHPT